MVIVDQRYRYSSARGQYIQSENIFVQKSVKNLCHGYLDPSARVFEYFLTVTCCIFTITILIFVVWSTQYQSMSQKYKYCPNLNIQHGHNHPLVTVKSVLLFGAQNSKRNS